MTIKTLVVKFELLNFRQLVQLAVERHPTVKVRLEQLLHTLNTHLAAIEKHEKQVRKQPFW